MWVLTPQCGDGTLYCKKHFQSLSDEMLNRGPDSLWSLKIPGCTSKKSRGVTPVSWPNFPIGPSQSWPPNHPHTLIGFITVFSPPVAGVWWAFWHTMAPGGYCTLVGVEEIPPHTVKRFECLEKHYINATNYSVWATFLIVCLFCGTWLPVVLWQGLHNWSSVILSFVSMENIIGIWADVRVKK